MAAVAVFVAAPDVLAMLDKKADQNNDAQLTKSTRYGSGTNDMFMPWTMETSKALSRGDVYLMEQRKHLPDALATQPN